MVAFDRFPARFGNEPNQILAAHALRRGGAGVVVNLFLDDGAIDVVGAEAERDLRDFRRHHLPVGFDVRKIIKYQAAHRDLLEVEHAGGLRQMLQGRVVGMKCQRDKRLEAVGFVLQIAQLQ